MAENMTEAASSASSALAGWKIAVDLVEALAWPLAVIVLALIFRRPAGAVLGSLVGKITKLTIEAGGTKVEADLKTPAGGDDEILEKVGDAVADPAQEARLRQWCARQHGADPETFDDFLTEPHYNAMRRQAVADLGL